MFRLSSSIVRICRGVALFSLGRGLGPDIFFSVYINQILNNHIFLVGLVAAIMPLVKMISSLFIGEIDDHANLKTMIYLSKIMYAACWILFFLAGRLHQPRILILAISLNGIASASLFTTYETHIRTSSKGNESAHNFWRYLSFFHGAHVIGGLLCALFISTIDKYTGLKSIFLFITVFSIVSLLIDRYLSPVHDGKRWIISTIRRISFSTKTFSHTRKTLKESSKSTRFFLILEFIYSILNYISFLFIPLLAAQRHMGLTEIAILYAIMRAPYILSIVLARFWERYPQKTTTLIVYMFLAIFCFGLGFTENANNIFIWTIGLSFGLAFIRPMILSGISEELSKQKLGSISGIQQGIGMLGCVAGSIGFASLSSLFGMSITFSVLGILIIVTMVRLAIRMHSLFEKKPPIHEPTLNSPYSPS